MGKNKGKGKPAASPKPTDGVPKRQPAAEPQKVSPAPEGVTAAEGAVGTTIHPAAAAAAPATASSAVAPEQAAESPKGAAPADGPSAAKAADEPDTGTQSGGVESKGAGKAEEHDGDDEGATEYQSLLDEPPLYAMNVKGPNGEQFELQVSPVDTVVDLRQFLADAVETCSYTCYELVLRNTKTNERILLVDILELGQYADVTSGDFELEIVPGLYDDRSARFHVRRTRELVSAPIPATCLSTVLIRTEEERRIAEDAEEEAAAGKEAANGGGATKDGAPSPTEGGAASAPSDSEKGKEEGGVEAEQQEGKKKGKVGELEEEAVPAEFVDGVGFMEESDGMLGRVLEGSERWPAVECVKSISFSALNPVPGYRRLLGDLLYVDVLTAEGGSFCVTSHSKGFFVNKTGSEVDAVLQPERKDPKLESATLVGLLAKVSPLFEERFKELIKQRLQVHQFEAVPLTFPVHEWLAPAPSAAPPHCRDVARADDALLTPHGADVSGVARDWNEELQSCRELPKESLQQRVLRDRMMFKVGSDFVDAAVKGAKAVVGRCIPPINPGESERFHMFVYNGIFFSVAVDSDFVALQQLRQKQEAEKTAQGGGKEGPQLATANAKEEEGGGAKRQEGGEANAAATAAEGESDSGDAAATSGSPTETVEQATYSSSNNDLKGTRAINSADVTGLYTLAMAIVDYRGHRVVAQSIIPGILYGDKTSSLLYGSVDNGKRIAWNEKFHAKMLEVAKFLHLKEHKVADAAGTEVVLCAPVESKGIVGADDRHYILDLMRLTPWDANFETKGGAGPTRLTVLRPELVAAFCQEEARAWSAKVEKKVEGGDAEGEASATTAADKDTGEQKDKDAPPTDEEVALPPVALNPNVMSKFKLGGSEEETSADEALVRKAGTYLKQTVIPRVARALDGLELQPMEGQSLTDALHNHGINMRYLGELASKVTMSFVRDLLVLEMVARVSKRLLRAVLRDTWDWDGAPAIAHCLNCIVGAPAPPAAASTTKEEGACNSEVGDGVEGGKNAGEGKEKDGVKGKDEETKGEEGPVEEKDGAAEDGKEGAREGGEGGLAMEVPVYKRVTSESLWEDIVEGVKLKYGYELPEGTRGSMRKLSLLRAICKKVGVTIVARDYDFALVDPLEPSDVVDLAPLVKHAVPRCKDAVEQIELGKQQMQEDSLSAALDHFSDAYQIIQQVMGPLHPDMATVCRLLAIVQWHLNDIQAAVVHQHRELLINERTLGRDHPDTAQSYANVALFYQGIGPGQNEVALRHMQHSLRILTAVTGPNHPECISQLVNAAMLYQEMNRMATALRYLQDALTRTQRLLGEDHIQTAICKHALAMAFNHMGNYRLAIKHEQSTYVTLRAKLGVQDQRTIDSYKWLRDFYESQTKQLQQKQTQQLPQPQGGASEAAKRLVTTKQLQAWLASQAGGSGNLSKQAAIAQAQQGKRVDERTQKAAMEVRKRAAARGVGVRGGQGGSSSHPSGTPSLEELLQFINSGGHHLAALKGTPQAPAHGASHGVPAMGRGSPRKGVGQTGGVGGTRTDAVAAAPPVPAGLGVGVGGEKGPGRGPMANGKAKPEPLKVAEGGLGGLELDSKKGKKKVAPRAKK